VSARERNMEKAADGLNLAAQTDPDNHNVKKLRTIFNLTNESTGFSSDQVAFREIAVPACIPR
jgi:hypothetical protein